MKKFQFEIDGINEISTNLLSEQYLFKTTK